MFINQEIKFILSVYNNSYYNNSYCNKVLTQDINNYKCTDFDFTTNCCLEIKEMFYKYLLNTTIEFDKCYNYNNNTFKLSCNLIKRTTSLDLFTLVFGLIFASLFFLV